MTLSILETSLPRQKGHVRVTSRNCTSHTLDFRTVLKTRMHSSRMRTICCSSPLIGAGTVCKGGVCLQGCLPEECICPGRGYLPERCLFRGVFAGRHLPRGMSARGCLPRGVFQTPAPNPRCRQNERKMQKHYLAATTLWTVRKQEQNRDNFCRRHPDRRKAEMR